MDATPSRNSGHSPAPVSAEPDRPVVQPLGRVIGIAHEYRDLIALIRGRIVELGISHEVMDSVTGLPVGYSSKILADPPIRKLGAVSLGLVLGGLGLQLIVAEDAAQTLKVRPRLELRRRPFRLSRG
jgi:hypothetical protein